MYPHCYREEVLSGSASDFDFQAYQQHTRTYYWSKLKIWGGYQRNTNLEYCTEYYLMYRIIKFNKSKAILRESLVKELNNLLKNLNIKATISISGLPTEDSIDKLLTQMENSDMDLKDAYEASCST